MGLNTLRVSHSSFCELSCGYCKVTQSKKNTENLWPTALPPAKNLVLPCNSFYREDLEEQVDQIQSQFKSVTLELHFLTVALERNQEKLSHLAKKNYFWIVHIDHLDGERVKKLKHWDSYVREYRIIPSKLYPATAYLRDLPEFIQRKMKWLFAPKEGVTDDFTELEDVPALVEDLKNAALHTFETTTTHWNHTLASAPNALHAGKGWRALDAKTYADNDWPLHLAQGNEAYLGYVADPDVKVVDAILEKNKTSVIYIPTPNHGTLTKAMSPFLSQAPRLFFLENFLVRKEIWQVYLRTYSSYNHWTWSHFIKNENIQSVTAPSGEIDGRAQNSLLTLARLREECRRHYLQTLDGSFYRQYFYFLQENGKFLKTAATLFSILFSLKSIFPEFLGKKCVSLASSLRRRTENIQYSLTLLVAAFRKLSLFIFHKSFWSAHAKYWNGYEATTKISGRGYAIIVNTYWAFYRGYRFIYNHTAAPTLGFLASLADFPSTYNREPWLTRWRLKLNFIIRKWAWLALKIAGQR